MWKPADNLNWQKDALCAKPSNRKYIDWFFDSDIEKKYAAKNMCFQCPVRSQCLQWALEHRQIWGVWGGKDEVDIRRALSVSYLGEETRRRRYPNCPFCSARPEKLDTLVVELDGSADKTQISAFIETMPIMDSKYISKFVRENEPRIDLNREVTAPSGKKVTVRIAFGAEFFRPFF